MGKPVFGEVVGRVGTYRRSRRQVGTVTAKVQIYKSTSLCYKRYNLEGHHSCCSQTPKPFSYHLILPA
jgi:hypothetical protein